MKRLLIAAFLLLTLPVTAGAQTNVTGGGTGRTFFPIGAILIGGTSSVRLDSTYSPTVGSFTATSTTATSSLTNVSISGGLSIAGQYFTNLTTFVRSLFTEGDGIDIAAGVVSFNCTEVEGVGINCSSNNVTLDATGDWTGTFDGLEGSAYEVDLTFDDGLTRTVNEVDFTCTEVEGAGINCSANDITLDATGNWSGTFDSQEGTYYLNRTNHTGQQTASTISDFTTAVRTLLSSTANGLTYTSGTGVFSLTSGYNIPLTASTTDWNTAYINRITSATAPLSIVSNVISISTAGDWGGTFDGQEGTWYRDRANHTGTQLASTISDFSTAVNSYIHGSTTIPKTYTTNTFTGVQSFTGGVTIGSGNGPLQVNAGVVSATTSVGVIYGGTGLTTVAQGDLLYGSAVNTIVALAKNTTATRYLANTGTSNNPAWAQITLTNGVTGTLPVGNGGTGVATCTADRLLTGNGTGAFTCEANLTFTGALLTVIGNASTTGFSSSYASTTVLAVRGDVFNDLTGVGLLNSGNALTLDNTGDWAGTFASQGSAYYLDRANHTGTQLASTISDFATAVVALFSAGTGLDFSAGVFSLEDTAVTPGSYTNADITVDQQGRITLAANGAGGGAVTDVSNVDGSLTVSPTTGNVIASLNTGFTNTWSVLQRFTDKVSFSLADTEYIQLIGGNFIMNSGTYNVLISGPAGSIAVGDATGPFIPNGQGYNIQDGAGVKVQAIGISPSDVLSVGDPGYATVIDGSSLTVPLVNGTLYANGSGVTSAQSGTSGRCVEWGANGALVDAASGAACGAGGGGTNYLTSSSTDTFLNTGSVLQAPAFQATSTASSTFRNLNVTNALTINKSSGNFKNFPAETVLGLLNGDGLSTSFTVDSFANGSSLVSPAISLRGSNGTAASPTLNTAGQLLGVLGFWGNNGTDYALGARMLAYANPTWSSTNNGTGVIFSTTLLNSVGLSERYRFVQSGNLGYASTSPWGQVSINASTTAGVPSFVVGSSTGTRLVVANSGMVGVGTATPVNKLHVYSDATADGLSIDGSSYPSIVLRTNGTIVGYAPFLATGAGGFFSDTLTGDMGFRSESNRVLFGVGSAASTMQVSSLGVGVTGTLTVATTTAGCAAFSSSGLLYSTGSSCGGGGGSQTPWSSNINAATYNLANVGTLGIGTSSPFQAAMTVDSGAASSTNTYLTGNVNNFMELNIQNRSNGVNASSDVVATADNGSATSHYIDMGINGSSGSAVPFTTANHAYLYSVEDTLNIGALGTASELRFFAGGGSLNPTRVMTMTATGNVGIGSSTPAALLAIASSTWGTNIADYQRPLLQVATSSNSFGQLFTISATTTPLVATVNFANSMTAFLTGARVLIGAQDATTNLGFGAPLSELTVAGRIDTPGWQYYQCYGGTILFSVIADANGACGDFSFAEDNVSTLVSITNATRGVSAGSIQTVSAQTNDGGGVFANASTIQFATSTPTFETNLHLAETGATTTSAYAGFTNVNTTGATFETPPTAGCYFTASSTQMNWQGVCRTSAALITQFDTGIASTSAGSFANAQDFVRMRIEASTQVVRFYMAPVSGTLRQVGVITTNIPNSPSTGTNAGIWYGVIPAASGNPRNLIFSEIKLWLRSPSGF